MRQSVDRSRSATQATPGTLLTPSVFSLRSLSWTMTPHKVTKSEPRPLSTSTAMPGLNSTSPA
jgi:hypothetical protein